MAEFPALPFFTDAYLADTIHLSTEEHGAYLLLLMTAWRTRGCYLPDDNKMLARITRTSAAKWRKLRPTMQAFFTVEDGRWVQKRLVKTYSDVEKRVAKNRINGAKGGRATARKNTETSGMDVSANPLKNQKGARVNAHRSPQAKLEQSDHQTNRQTDRQITGQQGSEADSQMPPTKTRTKLKQEAESARAALQSDVMGPDTAGIDTGKRDIEGQDRDGGSAPVPDEGAPIGLIRESVAPETLLSETSAPETPSQKTSAPENASPTINRPDWLPVVAAAAGLSVDRVNETLVASWLDGGADLEKDILPTLRRLSARQRGKLGRAPSHLGYYSDAVFEARATRLGTAAGNGVGTSKTTSTSTKTASIPQSEKQPFDANSLEDWRAFLGDANSRFRGDYLSKNWFISHWHPTFRECDLGPDPKRANNPIIPDAIYREYGRRWHWLGRHAADQSSDAPIHVPSEAKPEHKRKEKPE
ncbi:DUF1376 domain-containing protein [Kordiimonas sp. SCSIO 12610]|uniref:YdaU family protein n=1 Tax=Kordiimonas sp. SCSIO 12610 TaxID=2829597 RepID=UPI00210D1708|nr:DUF1376 domain-containing protein [Kordiimonas sp. SCSIO 12610]UTW56151.1 DUF1376 domain-containing protein [Kordiimonas sp. SCSIO 12610]